ncbi:hypothetical protein GOP47_0015875 [Adiantum capillus-veneris]|uniref:Transcriptional regulator STERILE APETALA n=1 Tax=Adiantum capillus-veneris TaxID=13818 RepID=A0A9D4UKH9_ADICA|nr:hypothetical protein GOP47_0015875 [Adiantum capillus-veneris]
MPGNEPTNERFQSWLLCIKGGQRVGRGRERGALASWWPEECVERVAFLLAAQAARASGPRSAAPALSFFFQVCSSWRAVFYSESLWRSLCIAVWREEARGVEESWQDTYIRLHRTASNFWRGRAEHSLLDYQVSSDSNELGDRGDGSVCRRLALSREYVAGGFSDGSLRIFSLASKECISTLEPFHESVIGPHSTSVAGISLAFNDGTVAFASMDGSVFAGDIAAGACRRVETSNYVNDGILVDFSGSSSRWAALYAGVRGRALHVWNAYTEELLHIGGDMTDADAYAGWSLLVNNADHIGRVRISQDTLAVVATRSKLCVLDMETLSTLFTMGMTRSSQALSASLALHQDRILLVCANGMARVWASRSMEETARVRVGTVTRGAMVYGAMNAWMVLICNNGMIDVWDYSSDTLMYRLAEERLVEVNDMVANNEYVVACCNQEEGIHVWDFTPR